MLQLFEMLVGCLTVSISCSKLMKTQGRLYIAGTGLNIQQCLMDELVTLSQVFMLILNKHDPLRFVQFQVHCITPSVIKNCPHKKT